MDSGKLNPAMSGEPTGQSVRKARDPKSGRKHWKDLRTLMIVMRRFGKTSSAKTFQLGIQVALEKSNVLESTLAEKQLPGCLPISESPLSPQRILAQNECNQKMPSVPCLAHLGSFLRKHSGSKDALVLALLAYFSLQFFSEDSLDESIAGMVFCTVVVVVLTSRMEGTAATELVRLIIQIASKIPLLWLNLLFSGLVTGSSAESSVQTSVSSTDTSNTLNMPFDIKVVAVTVFLGCFIIVVARKILTFLTRPEPVPVPVMFDISGGLDRTDLKKSNSMLRILRQV